MNQPEFDKYSASYTELLKDPIRDGFGGNPQFFHVRKRDLIRDHCRRQGIVTAGLRYLDVGCGQGELASMLSSDFAYVAGCDPSAGMMATIANVDVRVQSDPECIPFGDAEFDFITAVCVYHHVPPESRAQLTKEVVRVLRPGGVFAIIEHNPYNPITQLIVSRAPVDANAILLTASETRALMKGSGLAVRAQDYFLYLPEKLYAKAPGIETLLRKFPMGGQYAVFASR